MILIITEINVIISNKNHPKSISLFLSRGGASVGPNQDNLDFRLCLYKFIIFINFSLQSLKLIILIFSSITSAIEAICSCILLDIDVTTLMCRINNNNNNTYQLSGLS